MSNNHQPILNPTAQSLIRTYLDNPTHGLMIIGPIGSGKLKLARYLAAEMSGVTVSGLAGNPNYHNIALPDGKKEIPIELIRSTLNKTRHKMPAKKTDKRIILIEDANLMSIEAQNALLKDLEEPTESTFFIICASAESGVLPTISSRCQKISIAPLSKQEFQTHLENENRYTKSELESAWYLSNGYYEIAKKILDDGTDHPLSASVKFAKQIINKSRYEKLIALDGIVDDRQALAWFILASEKLFLELHHQALKRHNQQSANNLLKKRKKMLNLQLMANTNTNTRLLSLSIALSL